MTIYTNEPYTYRIGWSKTGMNYYGVRYAKNCHPDEFWIKYFTTSDYVTDYRKIHGEPDIIEIRKRFLTEDRVTDAREWEHRVLKKLKVPTNEKYLNKSTGKGIDPILSSRARKGVSPASKGKSLSESTKKKMRKPKEVVTCPHCGKSGGISVMYRHHFDNCGKKIVDSTLDKLRNSNTEKSNRSIVNEIRELRSSLTRDQLKKVSVQFGRGWYQWTDEILKPLLDVLKLEVPDILATVTVKKSRIGISNGRKGIPSPHKGKSGTRKGIPNKGPKKSQVKVTCPHCGHSGEISVMKRHHFDRCRLLFVPGQSITES
jgi:DNA-directed RNA polymerase subunit M/transcription elongation factor TFIIS